MVVADRPCSGPKGKLETRVTIAEDDDGDEEAERECVMRECFMGTVVC